MRGIGLACLALVGQADVAVAASVSSSENATIDTEEEREDHPEGRRRMFKKFPPGLQQWIARWTTC